MRHVLLITVLLAIAVTLQVRVSQQAAVDRQRLAGQEQARAESKRQWATLEARADEAFAEYRKQAQEALDELGRLEAATETGINYVRYTQQVAEANYVVSRFRGRYANKPEARLGVVTPLGAALLAYTHAGRAWRNKIDAEYGAYRYEEEIQVNWGLAGILLAQARRNLERPEGWRTATFYPLYTGSREAPPGLPDPQRDCQRHQNFLATELELYAMDNGGRYPTALPSPGPCPYGYESTGASGPPDLYTLTCEGVHP